MRRLEYAQGGTRRMLTADHPTDVALATGAPSVQLHVATCERCRVRAQSPPVPRPGFEQLPPSPSAPQQLVSAMGGIPDFDTAPAAGQLWRLEFDGIAAPAVIADADDDVLVVWAVGEDPTFADPATVVLDPSLLGMDIGVWTTLEFEVPRLTTERHLAELDDKTFARLLDVRARLAANEVSAGDGAGFTSELDVRLPYREELARPLHALSDLTRQLAGDNGAAATGSLRSLLDTSGLNPARLRELGFDSVERQALRDDQLYLTDDDIDRIAVAAKQPGEYVAALAPTPPLVLVAALHRPQRRRQVAEVATREGIAERTERRHAVRTIWTTDRRTTGSGEPDWEAAIDDYFAAR